MMARTKLGTLMLVLTLLIAAVGVLPVSAAPAAAPGGPEPMFSTAVAFDTTAPLRDLVAPQASTLQAASDEVIEIRPDRGPVVQDQGYAGDGALQGATIQALTVAPAALAGPVANFEGISNQDNFNLFGFRVNPPDPMGDVGPNHYVEMINLAFAIYDKAGVPLVGPLPIGGGMGWLLD